MHTRHAPSIRDAVTVAGDPIDLDDDSVNITSLLGGDDEDFDDSENDSVNEMDAEDEDPAAPPAAGTTMSAQQQLSGEASPVVVPATRVAAGVSRRHGGEVSVGTARRTADAAGALEVVSGGEMIPVADGMDIDPRNEVRVEPIVSRKVRFNPLVHKRLVPKSSGIAVVHAACATADVHGTKLL